MGRITFEVDKHIVEKRWQQWMWMKGVKGDTQYQYRLHHFYAQVFNVGLRVLDDEYRKTKLRNQPRQKTTATATRVVPPTEHWESRW